MEFSTVVVGVLWLRLLSFQAVVEPAGIVLSGARMWFIICCRHK